MRLIGLALIFVLRTVSFLNENGVGCESRKGVLDEISFVGNTSKGCGIVTRGAIAEGGRRDDKTGNVYIQRSALNVPGSTPTITDITKDARKDA